MPNVSTSPATPCPICQTTTPRPACESCLPRIDDIERLERIRMATQARNAIAINESKGLPVLARWRDWARVDLGLHPSSPSAPSAFNSDPPDTS